MKKTTIQLNDSSVITSRFDGKDQFYLYAGVDAIYGGWLLETSGTPTCLNELEDAGDEAMIATIHSILEDPSTDWEVLSDEDEAYIADTLNAWGL